MMASYSTGGRHPHSVTATGARGRASLPKQHMAPSFLELVSETPDLAAGAGMFIFTLAPFVLPPLALTALAPVALPIRALSGAMLVAPILLTRRWWWRSRDRSSGAVGLDLAAPACSGTGGARW